MKLPRIANALSVIFVAYGVVLLLPVIFALVDSEYYEAMPFLLAGAISAACGFACRLYGRKSQSFDNMKRTEGLFIVTLTWIAASCVGGLPYLFFGLSPVDALFESASGLTTTGATILTDFSLYPRAFFFWRSLTQWLGGLGILVLFVAVLPQFGVAGRKIFFAEAPGPTEEKITPRIAQTAKALWLIYLLLTLIEIVFLMVAGMPFYDALCNSLTTMSAGGFSPHPLSIYGYENNGVTWIVTFFMALSGMNYAMQYQFFLRGRYKPVICSEELRLYFGVVGIGSVVLTLLLFFGEGNSLLASLRDASFQIFSIVTTTGFSSADFALWLVPAQVVLIAMMCIGGCAGSAGGGVKVIRVLFVWRYVKREIMQLVHPQAVLPVKLDKTTVSEEIQRQMIGFLLFYILLILVSGLLCSMIEQNFSVGFIGTMATVGNVGPGLGEIGPMGTFGNLHTATKLIFIVDMLAGRLELVPFLVMLTPGFWNFIGEK